MFWENYVQLCNQNKVSPNAVAQKLGFSTGTVTWWKKGRQPRSTALQKIADYFNVSVDYLLGKEKKPSAPEGTEDMGENEKRLFAIWHQVPDEQKPELLNLIEAALRMQQGNSEK
ncbi:MAG: helix-turn-helix transcriptional regulator [Clostridia bacterium]|nr:helix-turn-helix transcriptional regulator [Clostridia bacterium]